MFKYLSVIPGSSPFVDEYILPKIKKLLKKYSHFLEDDYTEDCFEEFVYKVSPHLYAGFLNENFIGFVYLSDWKGGSGKFHSCTMTVCIDKQYWGKMAKKASKLFIQKIFKYYNLYKLKALVFENNKNVINYLLLLGFKKEGMLEGETFKNGKPINLFVYSIFNKKFKNS